MVIVNGKDRARISDSLAIEVDGVRRADDDLREFVEKERPTIQGIVTVEVLDGNGRVVQRSHGENILTLTGREFYCMRAVLASFSPRTLFRNDCLAYFGLGTGAQPEVAEVSSLVQPIEYMSGEFLAAVQAPASFPASVTSRTVSRLVREYGRTEISLGGLPVVVTEAGIFSDGDPADNWNTAARPTDIATTSGDAPFFYKAFEPVTKTPDNTLRLIWEQRVV